MGSAPRKCWLLPRRALPLWRGEGRGGRHSAGEGWEGCLQPLSNPRCQPRRDPLRSWRGRLSLSQLAPLLTDAGQLRQPAARGTFSHRLPPAARPLALRGTRERPSELPARPEPLPALHRDGDGAELEPWRLSAAHVVRRAPLVSGALLVNCPLLAACLHTHWSVAEWLPLAPC